MSERTSTCTSDERDDELHEVQAVVTFVFRRLSEHADEARAILAAPVLTFLDHWNHWLRAAVAQASDDDRCGATYSARTNARTAVAMIDELDNRGLAGAVGLNPGLIARIHGAEVATAAACLADNLPPDWPTPMAG